MKQQELQTIDAKIDALRKLFADRKRADVEKSVAESIRDAKYRLDRRREELKSLQATLELLGKP